MKRRGLSLLLASAALAGCGEKSSTEPERPVSGVEKAEPEEVEMEKKEGMETEKVEKTDAQWKEMLSPQQYKILRKKGTERAFTGKYHDLKKEGIYLCAGCGRELFSSESKFDSGTGWPSYWAPVEEGAVGEVEDRGLFRTRTEVVCSRCGGHLGHVFKDGPEPTGLRYCINSAALEFSEKK